MPYQPILGTLAYVISPERTHVLMIHRDRRPGDLHFGKYNGLGGKLHADEDVIAGMIREVREESGIEPVRYVLRGTISWPGFGKEGQDWFGFIFRVDEWRGTVAEESPEGSLRWVEAERLMELPLWEGDRHFLHMVLADRPEQFHGVMPYDNGRPASWEYHTSSIAGPDGGTQREADGTTGVPRIERP